MQIIAFLLFLLAVVLLLLAKDNVDKTTKWTLLGSLITLSILAFGYEQYSSNIEEKNRTIVTNFQQGKTLICDSIKVTKERFNYENGTGSFVAKKEIKELAGVILPISTCDR